MTYELKIPLHTIIFLSLCLQDGLLDRLDDVEQEVAKNPDEQVKE